jgi:hypothetical protein
MYSKIIDRYKQQAKHSRLISSYLSVFVDSWKRQQELWLATLIHVDISVQYRNSPHHC